MVIPGRIALSIAMSLALVFMADAQSAAAERGISEITFGPAVVDVATGSGWFTITFTCLSDLGYLRARGWVDQKRDPNGHAGGRGDSASSQNAWVWFGCTAGQTLTGAIGFGGQQGRFLPGPAIVHGFVEWFPGVRGYGPTRLILRAMRR